MSFIHHVIARRKKEEKERMEEELESPIKVLSSHLWEDHNTESLLSKLWTLLQTVLGSLARNSITATSDTVSCHSAALASREREGPGQKKRRRRTWQPDSIEQVPFRFQ